jgi:hypothetical protein
MPCGTNAIQTITITSPRHLVIAFVSVPSDCPALMAATGRQTWLRGDPHSGELWRNRSDYAKHLLGTTRRRMPVRSNWNLGGVMGIFWDSKDQPSQTVVNAFRAALAETPPEPAALDGEAQARATAVTNTSPPAALNRTNLLVALLIVAVLLGAAIGTDAANLPNSSKALYALATTAFGIVVGLLTGEKPTS